MITEEVDIIKTVFFFFAKIMLFVRLEEQEVVVQFLLNLLLIVMINYYRPRPEVIKLFHAQLS